MEGIDIQTIQEALSGGRWLVALGLILIALSAASGYVTEGRLPEKTAGIVAVCARLLRGIGASLVAGVIWWQALLAGALVSLFAKQTLDFIRGLLPGKGKEGTGGTGPQAPFGATVGAATMLLLVFGLGTLSLGCAANPCLAERATFEGVRAAVGAVDAAMPEDLEAWDEAQGYNTASLEIGAAAVEACELAQDRGPWESWISIGLQTIAGSVLIAHSAGADIPEGLYESLRALRGMSSL